MVMIFSLLGIVMGVLQILALPSSNVMLGFVRNGRSDAMLELFYWPTPNGKKVTVLLEELGVPYTIKATNIGRGDQFDGRIPEVLTQQPHAGTGR